MPHATMLGSAADFVMEGRETTQGFLLNLKCRDLVFTLKLRK